MVLVCVLRLSFVSDSRLQFRWQPCVRLCASTALSLPLLASAAAPRAATCARFSRSLDPACKRACACFDRAFTIAGVDTTRARACARSYVDFDIPPPLPWPGDGSAAIARMATRGARARVPVLSVCLCARVSRGALIIARRAVQMKRYGAWPCTALNCGRCFGGASLKLRRSVRMRRMRTGRCVRRPLVRARPAAAFAGLTRATALRRCSRCVPQSFLTSARQRYGCEVRVPPPLPQQHQQRQQQRRFASHHRLAVVDWPRILLREWQRRMASSGRLFPRSSSELPS